MCTIEFQSHSIFFASEKSKIDNDNIGDLIKKLLDNFFTKISISIYKGNIDRLLELL
jgi:hypothetical protein